MTVERKYKDEIEFSFDNKWNKKEIHKKVKKDNLYDYFTFNWRIFDIKVSELNNLES